MYDMNIHTFNVLHICHELNYNKENSFILSKYENENDRIMEIFNKIIELFINDIVIVCLQEVPHILLEHFKRFSKNDYYLKVYYYKLPRYPKSSYNIYQNNSEYLVTLIYDKINIDKVYNIEKIQYADYGKAALICIIDTYDICCINTHLPINNYGGKDAFEFIKDYIDEFDNCILLGDFNKNKKYAMELFKKYNMIDSLQTFTESEKYTYKRKLDDGSYIYKSYDHIFIFSYKNKYSLTNTQVIDDEISDHSLVSTCLQLL